MWPWEHLAVGYLLYSGGRRLLTGLRPATATVVTLAVGTQFPDLVDKPLAWAFDVLPSGLSLGHSLFFVVPVSLLAVVVAARRGRRDVGVGFAVGLFSHLLGDALFYLLTSGTVVYRFVFWPLYGQPGTADASFFLTVWSLFEQFQAFLGTPRGRLYLLFEVVLLGTALVLWLSDGTPGLDLVRWLRPSGPEEASEK